MTTSDTIDIFDIVKLYNTPLSNPINNYEAKELDKIKKYLTVEEQQIFVGNFHGYLNYNDNGNDKSKYHICLNDIFDWLGYARKCDCKKLLLKHFSENIDYIIKLNQEKGEEHIYLTINCFKRLCLRANTPKAEIIKNYYVNITEILGDILQEQSIDFVNLLIQKNQQMLQKDEKIKDLKNKIKNNISEYEQNIINISKNRRLLYIGIVEDNIIKFGITKDIERRILKEHKKNFESFTLKYVFLTELNSQLEDKIKEKCEDVNNLLYNCRITKKYKNKNQTELIKLDDTFTIRHLKAVIFLLLKKIDCCEYTKEYFPESDTPGVITRMNFYTNRDDDDDTDDEKSNDTDSDSNDSDHFLCDECNDWVIRDEFEFDIQTNKFCNTCNICLEFIKWTLEYDALHDTDNERCIY